MNRPQFARLATHLIWFASLWIALAAACSSAHGDTPARPNILLILTDDQGWPTLGAYGGEAVPTPHLDKLAAQGAVFTDAYVTSQCTPTRATLLTGQYTARMGLWHVLSWYGYPRARVSEPMFAEGFERETFTLAKGLRSAGYRTGIMGKWHLTSNEDGNYMGLSPDAAHHYGFDYAPPILSRDEFADGGDRGVATLTEQAIEFIKASKDQPWFCFLSHHMIHGKVVAPDSITAKYRERGFGDIGPNRAVYLAGLDCIDQSIGRLMQSLDAMGEDDETLVLFISDNGGIDERLDFKRLTQPHPATPAFETDLVEYDNAPLRAGKGSVYEGGVRVPFIVRWPGQVQPASVISTPVHVVDIASTCFAAAGTVPPEIHTLDGRDLSKLMRTGKDKTLDNRAIFQYYPFYDLRWGLTPSASVRLGEYKLIEFFGDRVDDLAGNRYRPGHHVELYNLRDDLRETRNLATSQRDTADRLLSRLHTWLSDLGAPAPQLNPRFNPAQAFLETREKPAWLRDVRWYGAKKDETEEANQSN